MENKSENQIVADLATKSVESYQQSVQLPDKTDRSFLFVSKGVDVHSLDGYTERPERIKQSAQLNKPEGFFNYVNQFKSDSTVIFGDPDSKHAIKCILDYHQADIPSRCTHIAELIMTQTVPWARWDRACDEVLSHKGFINFLKDNIEDVQSPDHAKLLQSVMEFSIGAKANSKSAIDGHNESLDISTEFSASDIPETIEVGLAPYRYLKHYKAIIRVSVRAIENSSVGFSLEMTNKERILERVFDDLVEFVEDSTEIKVFV